jgi:DNA-binding NarL/FixJ family response regulator
MSRIRVFIVDDHGLVRVALRMLLDGEDDLEVVGEAGDTQSAISDVLRLAPDVVLLDLRIPGGGGIEVCRRVKESLPQTAVLVITSFDADDEVFSVLEAGASGYLMKDTRPERVAEAVRSVHEGQAVLDAGVAARVVSGRAGATRGPDRLAEPLSERELEVLRLMVQGMNNRDIGHVLFIGEATVKTHVSHILRKLGQRDRLQAVVLAER